MTPSWKSFLPLSRSSKLPASSRRPTRKPLVRRQPDDSQLIRQSFQVGFLLLNLWLGAQFYLWVRYYETGGATLRVARPAGVEGWLPIAALMNLKYLVLTGDVPDVHAAGMFLLVAFLAISLLVRKAFCSWLCPVGTLSEWLWQGGEAIFGRTFKAPRWLDLPLRSLKYILMGLFMYAVASMSADDIRGFLTSPYGVVADVRMLNFFRFLGGTGLVVICLLLIASVFVRNAWCRYLCPYGAMMGLASLLSPARIRREPDACIDCAKCATACPYLLPVDTLLTVKSAECTACLLCVTACPAEGALQLSAPRRRELPAWAVATAIAVIFFGAVGYARLGGYWHTSLPEALYFDVIPRANQFSHP